ncbi:MAG: nucleotidyltransferase family protein [Candidatus Brocadiaceae bacterium]|nr:nucleotidyltransferase family protein [Candidatus Brocadiaceae bacterium]
MDIDVIKMKLEEKASYIRKAFHINEIGIFGSFTRREQSRKSDIDILVEFDKGYKDFFNYMRLKYYLEGELGKEVDIVMKGAIKPRLQERILDEVVYV